MVPHLGNIGSLPVFSYHNNCCLFVLSTLQYILIFLSNINWEICVSKMAGKTYSCWTLFVMGENEDCGDTNTKTAWPFVCISCVRVCERLCFLCMSVNERM